MSARPPYLDDRVDWAIQLDEGPSLKVSAAHRTRTLYPLRRLSRVVSPASATWESDALVACMKAGVVVLFTDCHGEPIGWCFGGRKRESTLASLLRLAIEEPDGADWIRTWERHWHKREMGNALRRLDLRPVIDADDDRFLTMHVRSLLCNAHRRRLGKPVGRWLRGLQSAVSGLAANLVQDYVGDPSLIAHPAPGIHLGVTITHLLEWRLHYIMSSAGVSTLDAKNVSRWAAQRIDQHASELYSAVGSMLGSLEYQLRQRVG